jgi:hypothetical protein
LLPYQRPTYRSIEVRTEHGIEERSTRFIGDPAERLAQIVVGAIIAQPDIVAPANRPRPDGAAENAEKTADNPRTEPVDNGDGVLGGGSNFVLRHRAAPLAVGVARLSRFFRRHCSMGMMLGLRNQR